ncbi:MAG TPA: HEAT repeat domain-containing protein [Polyangiaceae bacterium]
MSAERTLEQALGSSDPEERRQAVSELAGRDSERRPAQLLAALGDEDWRVRKQAIEVAKALPSSPELLAALVRAFEPGDNVGLRNAAVEALAAFGTDAVDAIATRITSLDADGKKLAAEALARTESPVALEVLRPLSAESDPNVQAAAIDAIAAVGGASAGEAVHILRRFLDSEQAFVRLSALDAINRLGARLSWPVLERLLDDPVLERSALTAAGRAAHAEALPTLLAALDRSPGAIVSALTALVDYARAAAQNQTFLPVPELSSGARDNVLSFAAPAQEDLALRKLGLVAGAVLGIEPVARLAAEALSDPRLFADADEALGFLGEKALPALLECAAHSDADACAACIEIAARLTGESNRDWVVNQIRSLMQSHAPQVVRAGLGAVTALGDEASLGRVAAWLEQEDVAGAAESALAALAERYPEAARALAREATADGPSCYAAAVIHSALSAPIRGSVADDVAFLTALLSHQAAAVRRAALGGLGNSESALGVEAAAFALTDEEPAVRYAAVQTLGKLRAADGSRPGLVKLLELVQSSDDQELIASALRALGESGDHAALAVLRPLVRTASPMVAVSAIEALARVPDARRVEGLLEGLSHPEAEVVKASILALGDAPDPRIVAHLGACLDHEAWDVRRLAADMLGRGASETAEALLRARLVSEDNPIVRDALTRALEGGGTRHTPAPPRMGSLRPR